MYKKTITNLNLSSFEPQLVYKDVLVVLNTILPEDEEVPLEILYDKNNTHFVVNDGEVVLTSKRNDAKYVAYEGVIPKEFNFEAKVNKDLLFSALNRLSVVTNKSTFLVQISVKDNVMTLLSEDVDMSRTGKETLSCECKGGFSIGFNLNILLAILKDAEGEYISLCMNEPSKPAVIKTIDDEKVMLLMPVI